MEVSPGLALPSESSLSHERQEHLITNPGRGPVCIKCKRIGHIRRTCDTPYCWHCDLFGSHISDECPTRDSFANRARAGTGKEDDTADYPDENDL